MIDTQNLLFAFLLTLFAGLSTGIGGIIAFFSKNKNANFLSISLGFSAGVMIYISFVEILFKAKEQFVECYNEQLGSFLTVIAFFSGILIIALIDKLIPESKNPHEVRNTDEVKKHLDEYKLNRMGIFTAVSIAIHNFPEGLATFLVALKNPALGVAMAIAIAIHNIPEGIAVSVPIYYATNSKKKALFYSFLSGLAEPLGAIVGYFILKPFLNDTVLGFVFGAVAGIMVFISLDELLPTAREYGKHHLAIYGLIFGMLVMALSLVILI